MDTETTAGTIEAVMTEMIDAVVVTTIDVVVDTMTDMIEVATTEDMTIEGVAMMTGTRFELIIRIRTENICEFSF